MGPYVHHKLTTEWAIEAGFSPEDAEIIGRACIHLDTKIWIKPWAHFRLFGANRFSKLAARRAMRRADLVLLGYAIHMAQDAIGHGWIMPFMHRPELDEWSKAAEDSQESIRVATFGFLTRYLSKHHTC